MFVANPKTYRPVDEALVREAQKKEEYRKAHELYHFGKNRVGFFNADWTPDEQKEIGPFLGTEFYDPQDQVADLVAATAGTRSLASELYD